MKNHLLGDGFESFFNGLAGMKGKVAVELSCITSLNLLSYSLTQL